MKYSEKWGTSVEEAVKLALVDLKANIEDVEVEIIEEPSKGFFGIGSKLAKVKVAHKEKTEEKKIEPAGIVKKFEESIKGTVKETVKEITKEILKEKPDNLSGVYEHEGLNFLRDIIKNMDLKLEVKAQGNEDFLFFEIFGEDTGTIIGKRGQTLDSIQYLTSLVVNKGKDKYIKVVIDAENYRAKREKTLSQLAERLADKVVKSRRPMKLEPMNPYERKVIHSSLQNHPKVSTRSEGEEPYRRVVIELKHKK